MLVTMTLNLVADCSIPVNEDRYYMKSCTINCHFLCYAFSLLQHVLKISTFNFGLRQMRVHGDGLKHLNDLLQSSSEGVKLSKDVHLGELEWPLIGHLLQLFLGFMEAALVLLIELDAVVEFTDDVCLVLSPHSLCFLTTNVGLTGCDHLVSDLEKRVYNY